MAKPKNPLYVVKKKSNVVEEASGLVDLIVKKLNMEPAIQILNNIFQLLLGMVQDYPTFKAIKEVIDLLVGKLQLFTKFGIA